MKLLITRAMLVAMVLLFGSAWRQASTELRGRPERAMATVVRCVEDQTIGSRGIRSSTLDVVFTDRQGQRREAKGLDATGGCGVRGEPREIAYAAEAPEQAIFASRAFLLLARFLFFLGAVALLDVCFFHKARRIVRVLFLSSAAGLLYYFLV